MKKLHLICNAHLDPVWMWDFDDGMATALATFYTAAELCDEFNYIFCHNDAILYEYVEKFDPKLFKRIQAHVKNGRWHIMGGWYLQPDCNLLSGETFVRQAMFGKEYFESRFGCNISTAVNFDSFGHSAGLVQILNKCGYDSYIFCRPMPELLALPDMLFWWKGTAGSAVKAVRFDDAALYSSELGKAKENILRKSLKWQNKDSALALWGVGNHGGGPSRKDLRDIETLIKESGCEVVHSTPERYFSEVTPSVSYEGSLTPCFIGCYSSMNSVKQKHIEVENALYMTEKICALADMCGKSSYDFTALDEAQRKLLAIGFHDILSGTCGPDGEKSALAYGAHALTLLNSCFMSAFFGLSENFTAAKEGEFPILIFNPHATVFNGVTEVELLMPTPCGSDTEQYEFYARSGGVPVPVQIIKELSNINYDRKKRLALRCPLKPMGVTRVDLTAGKVPLKPAPVTCGNIIISDSVKTVKIGAESGLLESLVINGKEQICGGAFLPYMLNDNADPWGWYMEKMGSAPVPFELCNNDEAMFKGLSGVKITEEGEVLTETESIFKLSASRIRISYKIYKDLPYIDVKADVFWNEKEKCLKFKIGTNPANEFIGQTAYATETFLCDGLEKTAQRFVAVPGGGEALAVYNNCVSSFSHDGNALWLTLLRGAAYCAHPIGDKPLVPEGRFTPYIEQGRHSFHFRIGAAPAALLEKNAADFNQKPYALNVFPHGNGNQNPPEITVTNESIVLTVLKKSKDGKYILRLINNTNQDQECGISINKIKTQTKFIPGELKTLIFNGNSLTEHLTAVINC